MKLKKFEKVIADRIHKAIVEQDEYIKKQQEIIDAAILGDSRGRYVVSVKSVKEVNGNVEVKFQENEAGYGKSLTLRQQVQCKVTAINTRDELITQFEENFGSYADYCKSIEVEPVQTSEEKLISLLKDVIKDSKK